MLTAAKTGPQPSHVTVKFKDGAHTFLLPGRATLTELAGFIEILGAHHAGQPISVDIAVAKPSQRRGSRKSSEMRWWN